jgi:hypothetical protein
MMVPVKPSDPVIDEVRKVRHHISARVDHNPAKLVAYYMRLQEQYQDRLIGSAERAEHKAPPSAAGSANS